MIRGATAPDLLRRALASLPAAARRPGRVVLRADAGYFAGALARATHDACICLTIGAKRIAPLRQVLAGIGEDDWHDAIDMDGAQAAEWGNRGYVRIVRPPWPAWASLAKRIA
jgi:hypothetical protein